MIHDFVLSLLVFRACKKLPLWATTTISPFSAVTIDCWSSFLKSLRLFFAEWRWIRIYLSLLMVKGCVASSFLAFELPGFWRFSMNDPACFLGVAWPLAMITLAPVFLLWWLRLVSSCCHCRALNGCSQHEFPPTFFPSHIWEDFLNFGKWFDDVNPFAQGLKMDLQRFFFFFLLNLLNERESDKFMEGWM